MKSDSIPPALRNLLTKLEYISMIERGQKPCFSDMTFVQSNSWLGAWKRLVSGENRKNLLFEIEQIIDRTILAIEEYANKEYVRLLLENLSKAKTGIENLMLTYTEHPDTISNLRVHLINIDLTLKKYNFSPSQDFNKKHIEPVPIQNVSIQTVKTNPVPIGSSFDYKKYKSPTEGNSSFKRFTPKEYIEKHILSTSNSSPDIPQRLNNEELPLPDMNDIKL
jgi:hypothetical protein